MWIICGVLSVIFCVIGRIMVSKKKKNTACVLKVKQIFKHKTEISVILVRTEMR